MEKDPKFTPAFFVALIFGSWGAGAMLLEHRIPYDFNFGFRFFEQSVVVLSLTVAAVGVFFLRNRLAILKKSWAFALIFVTGFLCFFLILMPASEWANQIFEGAMEEFVYDSGEQEAGFFQPLLSAHGVWILVLLLYSFLLHRSVAATGKRDLFIYSTLATGAGLAFLPLQEPEFDVRGANLYIRCWQYAGILAVAGAVATLLWTLSRYRVFRERWFVSGLTFLFVFLATLYYTIPGTDYLAMRVEMLLHPSPPSEMGYGWFYWDDSGMGNNPSQLSSVFLHSILICVNLFKSEGGEMPVIWIVYSFSIWISFLFFLCAIFSMFRLHLSHGRRTEA